MGDELRKRGLVLSPPTSIPVFRLPGGASGPRRVRRQQPCSPPLGELCGVDGIAVSPRQSARCTQGSSPVSLAEAHRVPPLPATPRQKRLSSAGALAKRLGLRLVNAGALTISRRRCGRGFAYYTADGR